MLTELNSVKEELGGDCEIISVGLGVSHSAIVTSNYNENKFLNYNYLLKFYIFRIWKCLYCRLWK